MIFQSCADTFLDTLWSNRCLDVVYDCLKSLVHCLTEYHKAKLLRLCESGIADHHVHLLHVLFNYRNVFVGSFQYFDSVFHKLLRLFLLLSWLLLLLLFLLWSLKLMMLFLLFFYLVLWGLTHVIKVVLRVHHDLILFTTCHYDATFFLLITIVCNLETFNLIFNFVLFFKFFVGGLLFRYKDFLRLLDWRFVKD